MSAIAGIFYFDGRPVEHGQVEAMTSVMAHRGPDGIAHWRRASVALGQCMMRTTPESLEETQPLTNEDASLVLVMDGRVDNAEDLRRELLGKGASLRTRADAELVLRAFEVWGKSCPDHIIGECVFFIWDARRHCMFAVRDAAGSRHFYYHEGKGWFAFASEIKGLLALQCIERRLNESRLLDYLVPEYDRDDQVGTFYQGILRLPAGHAMDVTVRGAHIWRYWDPGLLIESRFASQAECTEAFMDQLRLAVRCRLRSHKPVGAMLSGGLDSSTIVGLISRDLRGELREPLRTFSLIQDDRERCQDWQSIEAILQADSWLRPTVLSSTWVDEFWRDLYESMPQADEPFGHSHGLSYRLMYGAAQASGCGVVLDGMAGDLLFYDLHRSAATIGRRHLLAQVPAIRAAYQNHGSSGWWRTALRAMMGSVAPDSLSAVLQWGREVRQLRAPVRTLLRPGIERPYLAEKRAAARRASEAQSVLSEQALHARNYTTGLLSFGHETYGGLAMEAGVEPRSPFSDRRVIEFAVRMPLAAKLASPWYKHLLRQGTAGILPDAVRWRKFMFGHPGWTFWERMIQALSTHAFDDWDDAFVSSALRPWVSEAAAEVHRARFSEMGHFDSGVEGHQLLVLTRWMNARAWAAAKFGELTTQ